MQNCTKRGFLTFFNAKKRTLLHKTMLFMQICIEKNDRLLLIYIPVAEAEEIQY